MPPVTCPECLAKFETTGARGASCPTCGYRLGSPRRPVEEARPRRSSRQREDYDDYDDRRPVRRPRRVHSTAGDSLIPLLILGGALLVVVLVGGIGFIVYRTVEKSSEPAIVRVRSVEFEPPGMAFTTAPDDGLPGVNPSDLAPGGPPLSGPPPAQPQPNDPSIPGVDPSQVQPPPEAQPPGMPRPPAMPGAPGIGPRGPGRPGMPQPPAMPQPPGLGDASVTLSNLRRGRGATTLELDYEFTSGSRHPVFDKLIVRTPGGTAEVMLHGPPQHKGSVRIRALGSAGKLQGKIEIWMERRSPTTLPGASGKIISNTVTLD